MHSNHDHSGDVKAVSTTSPRTQSASSDVHQNSQEEPLTEAPLFATSEAISKAKIGAASSVFSDRTQVDRPNYLGKKDHPSDHPQAYINTKSLTSDYLTAVNNLTSLINSLDEVVEYSYLLQSLANITSTKKQSRKDEKPELLPKRSRRARRSPDLIKKKAEMRDALKRSSMESLQDMVLDGPQGWMPFVWYGLKMLHSINLPDLEFTNFYSQDKEQYVREILLRLYFALATGKLYSLPVPLDYEDGSTQSVMSDYEEKDRSRVEAILKAGYQISDVNINNVMRLKWVVSDEHGKPTSASCRIFVEQTKEVNRLVLIDLHHQACCHEGNARHETDYKSRHRDELCIWDDFMDPELFKGVATADLMMRCKLMIERWLNKQK